MLELSISTPVDFSISFFAFAFDFLLSLLGMIFHSFPGNEKKVFTLRMFSCLVNNYFFSMIVSYNNEMDEKTLMNVVYSS